MRYSPKRLYTWTPSIAYSAGLIASDGCLQKDGRHIDLTSTDIEQLQNFCLALGRTLNISPKVNHHGQSAFRVQFSDVAYYDFLADIGIGPSKSLTLSDVKVPDELYADFLRGVFDGDGTTYGYRDKRWPSSFMFYTEFASASPAFITFIQKNNLRLLGLSPGSVKKGKGVGILRYAKKDSILLFEAMYRNEESLCLKRKKSKLEDFIITCRGGILAES